MNPNFKQWYANPQVWEKSQIHINNGKGNPNIDKQLEKGSFSINRHLHNKRKKNTNAPNENIEIK